MSALAKILVIDSNRTMRTFFKLNALLLPFPQFKVASASLAYQLLFGAEENPWKSCDGIFVSFCRRSFDEVALAQFVR